MYKLLLAPDANGYQSADGAEVIMIELDGGAGRYRTDKIGATKRVSVAWTMNRGQYQYWRAFYVTATKKGALPFLCDLVGEDGLGPAEHTCSFIPGSVTLPQQMGLTYVQQAQLEVTPLPHDEADDLAVIAAFEASEGDSDAWYAALENLVLVIMPATIGG